MKKRQSMREQDPKIRANNFDEVTLGYTEEEAILEAKRCLHCKNPLCMGGCPVSIDIPGFIKKIAERDFKAAYQVITNRNALPGVTGRVCSQEKQCEGSCIVGIKGEPVAIGNLERFVADWARKNVKEPCELEASCGIKLKHSLEEKESVTHTGDSVSSVKKVAIFGSGPAGLACAGDCAKMGYNVTVFEAWHALGGVLSYGIPIFRLPAEILSSEIEYLKSLGVKFKTNTAIGKTLTLHDLKELGFEAFFVSTGAGAPYSLNIPNEDLSGIYTANDFLTRVTLMNAGNSALVDNPINIGDRALVIGAGDVAMDSARTLRRIGFKTVYIVYRRTEDEVPARHEEMSHAGDEGVIFKFLMTPLEFIGDNAGKLKGVKVAKMVLTDEVDNLGRKMPKQTGESEVIDVDTAVVAIGQSSNPTLAKCLGVTLNKKQHIVIDENMQTSVAGVFAGGDITTGAATVIAAMGAGKAAVRSIVKYLSAK
ncbi:MAG: NADPH-dependent glutamate synthase [bacterium]|nr:NADPH-dependent glutamate synthase [bacterium]